MAKKKITVAKGVTVMSNADGSEVAYIPSSAVKKEVIHPLSVDFGREDLNTMARKINEIIVKING